MLVIPDSPTRLVTSFFLILLLCSDVDASVLLERGTRTHPGKLPTGTSLPTEAPAKWVHPGVMVERKQLDYISRKVAAGAQPWSGAFDSMLKYNYSSPTRTAKPYATVECGPTSTPNIGCYQEREDSMAAYMNALAWWITKSRNYADKAISYMDAWSSTVKAHTNSNAPLQAAWSAANWVRAGEITRYGHAGWSEKSIKTFEAMLRQVYLPLIIEGKTSENGNWELGMFVIDHRLNLSSQISPNIKQTH
jgi:hypothetical protein